jgi:hypothetical protein
MAIRITDDTMTVGTDNRLVAAHGLASAPRLRRTAQPGRLATSGRTRTVTAGSALMMGAPSRSGNSQAPTISPGRT